MCSISEAVWTPLRTAGGLCHKRDHPPFTITVYITEHMRGSVEARWFLVTTQWLKTQKTKSSWVGRVLRSLESCCASCLCNWKMSLLESYFFVSLLLCVCVCFSSLIVTTQLCLLKFGQILHKTNHLVYFKMQSPTFIYFLLSLRCTVPKPDGFPFSVTQYRVCDVILDIFSWYYIRMLLDHMADRRVYILLHCCQCLHPFIALNLV